MLLGLFLLMLSALAIRAAFEGAEGLVLVFAAVVGSLGLFFAGGGGYVMWHTIAALKRL